MRTLPVTVIVPALNEEGTIGTMLEKLHADSPRPAEVIVVDAGSTDRTMAIVQGWTARWSAVRLERAPGALPGRARNVGVAAAGHGVLLFTDAGLTLPDGWVGALAEPALRGRVDVVIGSYTPIVHGAMGLVNQLYVTCNAVEIAGDLVYYPTVASLAVTWPAWEAAGPFPEDLRACEDSLFFHRLYRCEALSALVSRRAIVQWHMGGRIGYLIRKMYQSGRGEVSAGLISRKTVFLGCVYPAALVIGCSSLPTWLIVGVCSVLMVFRLGRLFRENPQVLSRILVSPLAMIFLLIGVPVADVSRVLGFVVGWLLRMCSGKLGLKLFVPVVSVDGLSVVFDELEPTSASRSATPNLTAAELTTRRDRYSAVSATVKKS